MTLGGLSGRAARAHAIVDDLAAASGPGVWQVERSIVAGRLHQLVDDPDLVRQGDRNLCGPAALFVVWLRHDPAAVATYAARLFTRGRSAIGDLAVVPSPALLGLRPEPGGAGEGGDCPAADWLLMSSLRDSTNRTLRYAQGAGGPREAAAAITLPGAMRRWLGATGLFAAVRDDTALVLRRSPAHARLLAPGADREVLVLVAQEMFTAAQTPLRRIRDRVVGRLPNHWILLRTPVSPIGPDQVTFRYWSWGGEHPAVLDRTAFARGYHGCLDGLLATPPASRCDPAR